jgi:hypothetical protein
MLDKAAEPGCFDDLFVTEANQGLAMFDSSINIITGAIEILKARAVIRHCAAALRARG